MNNFKKLTTPKESRTGRCYMKNMSKKTRKKVMRIIKANCHSNDGC